MAYRLDPTASQTSFAKEIADTYDHVPVFPDGLMDGNKQLDPNGDEREIERFPDNSIKPFVVIWFGNPRRNRRGRGFVDSKLDSYTAGADVVVVARNGTEARVLLNDIGNTLIDWKPENSGRVVEGSALWRDARAVIDSDNRPTRFAVTRRFEWGLQHAKTI